MITLSQFAKIGFATLFACVLPFCAGADVPVAPGDYTGSRTVTGGGITATEEWSNGFKVAWSITDTGMGTHPFHYIYTISNENDGDLPKDLSHVILEVSGNVTAKDFNFIDPSSDIEGPMTFSPGPGNPGMPADVFGIKFDELTGGTFVADFFSTRAPVWGDFFAKDGGGNSIPGAVIAYNTGFGVEPPMSGPFNNWIPRPDTTGVEVPEPATVLLLSSSLAGAFWQRRKNKLKK